MPSQLSLYNGALLHLGERSLTSLTESRESRRLLDTVWARPAVEECLEQGQWKFATRSVQIEKSPSVTPSFGYANAFDRPTDIVRTVALCSDEHFKSPLLEYQVEGQYWFAEIDPIYVRYVSNDSAYGNDLSLWPANFTRYVEAYMAEAIVTKITQDRGEWQRIRALMAQYLKDAKATDAMEQPTTFPPPGTWVRSRSRGSSGERGNRSSLIG